MGKKKQIIPDEKIEYTTQAKPRTMAGQIPVFCSFDKLASPIELVGNPRNPNKHPPEQIKLLAQIIQSQGWRVPVTVSKRSGFVVRGHGRLSAALELRTELVPVDYQDYANEAEEWADLIADNRLAELSEMDDTLLADLLKEIDSDDISLLLTGYSDDDFDSLKDDLAAAVGVGNDDFDVDHELEQIAEPFTQPGDVYILGVGHRLICGDATKIEDVKTAVDNQSVQLIVTDPPYNVDYEGVAGKIMNDSMSDSKFHEFLLAVYKNIHSVSAAGASAYIFHADTEGVNFRTAFTEAGYKLKQCLIWVKNAFVLGRQDYHWQHEPILYGWKDGAAHYFTDDRTQSTVLLEDRPMRNAEHPTMKPVSLIGRLILNSSKRGDNVFDPFGGSGSTLISCEQLERVCFMMELDPKFCDVIVKRYRAYIQESGKPCEVKLMRGGEMITEIEI